MKIKYEFAKKLFIYFDQTGHSRGENNFSIYHTSKSCSKDYKLTCSDLHQEPTDVGRKNIVDANAYDLEFPLSQVYYRLLLHWTNIFLRRETTANFLLECRHHILSTSDLTIAKRLFPHRRLLLPIFMDPKKCFPLLITWVFEAHLYKFLPWLNKCWCKFTHQSSYRSLQCWNHYSRTLIKSKPQLNLDLNTCIHLHPLEPNYLFLLR